MTEYPIAIVGMACRFPRSPGISGFWEMLRSGVDAISEVPPERWPIEDFYHPNPATPGKMSTRQGGFIDNIENFDAEFFGIAPHEAIYMSPQQRILLEVAWEALEDAALPPDRLSGTAVGCYVGVSSFDYYDRILEDAEQINGYTMAGNAYSITANRLSYLLDLRGPSVAIDTACSSSLVAVHLACQSLRVGESTLALAGGTQAIVSPWLTVAESKGEFMAPDGRCKAFDARANGYVRGEGAGVVVLKRLDRALAEGDRIWAVILASAVNQDGRSNGLTAPNPAAQEELLREAYRAAGVVPGEIGYIEAHGTATRIGDPIEMKALGAVLAEGRPDGSRCLVGSVKTNFGHLEAAAGIAGLIKTVLVVHHGLVPPNLHFRDPNPLIPFEKLPLAVPRELTPWESTGRRKAGVSSFGFGGTNAHVVIAQAPELEHRDQHLARSAHLLCLSAKSKTALKALAARYAAFLSGASPDASHLANICHTAGIGRTHFRERLAVTGSSAQSLVDSLTAYSADIARPELIVNRIRARQNTKLAFLFSGRAIQRAGAERELWATHRVFRRTIESCDQILREYSPVPLGEMLASCESSSTALEPATHTRIAVFVLQAALVDLLRSWGITPNMVFADDLGELAAAYAAGLLDLQTVLRLAAQSAGSQMDAPLSSKPSEIAFADVVGNSKVRQDAQLDGLLESRSWPEAIEILQHRGIGICVGIGCALNPQQPEHAALSQVMQFLPALHEAEKDWRSLLQLAARLYTCGVPLNWEGIHAGLGVRRCSVPAYAFDRKRFWIETYPHPRTQKTAVVATNLPSLETAPQKLDCDRSRPGLQTIPRSVRRRW